LEQAALVMREHHVGTFAADLASLAGVIRSERERESAEND
jgi:hypothetical protein